MTMQALFGSDLTTSSARLPGRCPCCGWHLATQGHHQECLHGPRAWFALQPDGTWVHNPTPPPEPEPDTRYGPDGTTTPTGTLPTACRRCGDYGTHKHLCPSRAK